MQYCCALVALILLLFGFAHTTWAGQSCTPFGNPPQTLIQNEVPQCAGGTLLGPWKDGDGTPRYACLYEPQSVSTSARLPMVIYLHPSLVTADNAETGTNFLQFLNTANLNDNSARPGFILLAPEGRNTTHSYPAPDDQGPGWDNWYRELSPAGDVNLNGTLYRENVDAATIDHFMRQIVGMKIVDTNRIYVSGWSNGAAMGYLYGLSRPGIAAVGVYSAPNPFRALSDPCPQTPVFTKPTSIKQIQMYNAGLPTYHLHNDCDIAGICPTGEYLMRQLLPLGIGFQDTIINSATQPTIGCLDACGTNSNGDPNNQLAISVGTANHVRWPASWLPEMLNFFRGHPLNSRPQ